MPKPKSYVVTKQTQTPIYHDKLTAINAAKNAAKMYPGTAYHVSEVKENYTYEEPEKKGKFKRRYFKPEERKDDEV
jgi:hypothetical protein